MFWSNLGHFYNRNHIRSYFQEILLQRTILDFNIRDWYKDFLNSIRGSFSRGCDSFRVTPGCLTCFLCRLHVFSSMCDQCVWFCAANLWRLAGTADSFYRPLSPWHALSTCWQEESDRQARRTPFKTPVRIQARLPSRVTMVSVFNSSVYVHGWHCSRVKMCMPLITYRLIL